MIIPFSPEEMSTKSDDEIIAGYVGLGFDEVTAKAYLAVAKGARPAPVPEPSAEVAVTMTVTRALALADSFGHEELRAELVKSAEAGIARVTLALAEDDAVTVKSPEGVMVGWFLPDADAERLEVGDPHITLAFLGKAEELSVADQRKLLSTVGEVVGRHAPLTGVVKGDGFFDESGTWYAVPHVPGLAELRSDLADTLEKAGLPVSREHNFTPHISLASGIEKDEAGTEPEPFDIHIDSLQVAIGGWQHSLDLAATQTDAVTKSGYAPIAKADDEKRFTLAPVYIPGRKDAQGDWATAEDLQETLWKFSRGDRLIALQHKPEDGPMGEAVELMVVPWEHTVPMIQSDGSSEDVTFPAGTPWMGTVWNEDVWPLVKAGKVRGYSIGGRASMLDVDIPEAE